MSERYWAVTVFLNGDPVVTIEPNCLSGKNIGPDERWAIREAAENLLAFAGPEKESDMLWLPDDVTNQSPD